MKKLISMTIVITVLLAVSGLSEIVNLGELTPRTLIPLEKNTLRPDFARYLVEAMSWSDYLEGQTNRIVRFATTNSYLSITNFTELPSGRTFLGLRSECQDGSTSKAGLFVFSIWRADPPAPHALPVVQILMAEDQAVPLSESLDRLRESTPSLPPPPFPGEVVVERSVPTVIPGGTNRTYGMGLDREAEAEMLRYYQTGKK